jgi:hypothetical protein
VIYMTKITLSDAFKKDLRIVGYLVASGVLAYILSLITKRPEGIYATPIINFILYRIIEELKGEGYIEAIRNK